MSDDPLEVLEDWPKDVEIKEYAGGCHCRKFCFKFAHPAFENGEVKIMSCNCSICNQHGLLHIYTPESRFAFSAGSFEELASYRLPGQPTVHLFCSTCGSNLVVRSEGEVAINVRAVDGIDVKSGNLRFTHFDGRNRL